MHDPIKHIKYLRQALSQDKKRIGFFISAGCPLAVDMPTGSWPLIPAVQELTIKVNLKLKAATGTPENKYDLLLKEIALANKNIENIEDILTFIRGLKNVSSGGNVRGFTENELELLEKNVCSEIASLLNVSLPDLNTPYHNLASWINSIDREVPVEIFTTNYDLLMEQAFEDNSVPFFDGFVGSRFPFFDLRAIEDNLIPKHWSRLWKIHGSINWLQNSSHDVYRTSYLAKYEEANLIYPSHLKYEQSRKMPYLALIDQLSKFIRQPSSLLILCGYSFNDMHLNGAIINALKSNPTAIAIALMYDTGTITDPTDGSIKDRYPNAIQIAKQRSNLSLWCYDEAIIGTLRGEWKVNKVFEDHENIATCVETKVTITPGVGGAPDVNTINHWLKLGDFATMGRFLQALIGINQTTTTDAK
ncbi:SIR2 family protein [Ferruginibacter sp. HRS2-29]|nr:SIR2 family protein [Ferruginibacter sp. HRS2-29]